MVEKCLICKKKVEVSAGRQGFVYNVTCPVCGSYQCEHQFSMCFKIENYEQRQRANIKGWIQENQGILLTVNHMDDLQNIRTPGLGERAEKLMKYWAKKYPTLGIPIPNYAEDTLAWAIWESVSYSKNQEELKYLILHYLRDDKRYLMDTPSIITPLGWEYIDSLEKNENSQKAFVAMSFKPEMQEFYKATIQKAILNAGYEPIIMWEKPHINKIDDEIISLIKGSKFVVVDYTEQNNGAYYEAGFARGFGIKVVSTCNKEEIENDKLHFDTRQYNTIPWEKDKPDEFINLLQFYIEANIGKGNYKPK